MTSEPPSSVDATPGAVGARPARRSARLPWRVFCLVVLLYVAWCVALYFYQDKLLFPADLTPGPLSTPVYDATSASITIGTEEGRSVAWFVPARGASADKPAPVVIYFHGNAELIDYQSTTVDGYRAMGWSVLLPEYRGYGRSDGTPSEQTIVADAVRFYDELVKRPEVDAGRIILHGRSVGGGPAAQLAARRPCRGLILESTFTSVADMASKYFVPDALVKNPLRTDQVLPTLDAPVLVFHGTRDNIIPVAHGRRLKDLAKDARYVEYNCRHNDFPGDGNEAPYWREITAFLQRVACAGNPQRPLEFQHAS